MNQKNMDMDFEEDTDDILGDYCYVQLQGWMIKLGRKFGLTLNELMIYAVIHSFSRGGGSGFRGSHNYLEQWAFCGRTSVFGKIKKLMKLNLIGRKYVMHRGRRYTTFFSMVGGVETNGNDKKIDEGSRRFGERDVQNLDQKDEEKKIEFKNCTDAVQYLDASVQKLNTPVQNLDENSSEFGPNNNLNNNLKKAAAEEHLIDIIPKDGVSGCEEAEAHTDGVVDEKSFDEQTLIDFGKIDLPADETCGNSGFETLDKKITKEPCCPVCGAFNHKGIMFCRHCGFDFSYRNNFGEVEKARMINSLSPGDKMRREKEIMTVLESYPLTDFKNIANIRTREVCLQNIDRKYKTIAQRSFGKLESSGLHVD